MSEIEHKVLAALRNVPRLATVSLADLTLTRLGGLTNLVFKVEIGSEKLIVRIPGEGTNDYIDRAVELHNAQVAARAEISAEIIWADAASGTMISRCIDPITTMTPALFACRKGAAERAGVALKRLHNCGEKFQFRFELFAMIDDYLGVLSGKDIKLPDGYREIVAAALPVKQVLSDHPIDLVPCHCDPLCENFLDDGTKMWIVDWEYSGMNDPMWDLGDLSVEAEFNGQQDSELLGAYFGNAPTAAQVGRMVIYKAMCDLLWTLWGLIQHADGNVAEDFHNYALTRFSRCKKLMFDPAFAGHLDAVRNE